MQYDKAVSEHYAHGELLEAIQASIAQLGKTIDTVTIEDLAPVDEFHIGGPRATHNLLNQLSISERDHILDVGCGMGGTTRYIAKKYNNRVTGIDLTQEYINVGRAMCTWVGLNKQVTLKQGSALSMPFESAMFDGALMLHVGMNINDKSKLFAEIYRLLQPGAFFAIYDVMRMNDGELTYPVPWATGNSTSRLATPDQYKQALEQAGFELYAENNRREFALNLFQRMRVKAKEGAPPPLGLHTLLRKTTALKVKNMISGIMEDLIAPVEIIVHKKSQNALA